MGQLQDKTTETERKEDEFTPTFEQLLKSLRVLFLKHFMLRPATTRKPVVERKSTDHQLPSRRKQGAKEDMGVKLMVLHVGGTERASK